MTPKPRAHIGGLALAMAAASMFAPGADRGLDLRREPVPTTPKLSRAQRLAERKLFGGKKDKTAGIKSKGRRGARQRMLAMEAARRR